MANDTEGIIKDTIEAVNSHDIDRFISYYTDDCFYEDTVIGKVARGKDELKDLLITMYDMSPDIKFELKSVFSTGDWACSEWVLSGTHAASGKNFSVRGATINQLSNGKLSRHSDYWNIMLFLQQVGLMPETTPNA